MLQKAIKNWCMSESESAVENYFCDIGEEKCSTLPFRFHFHLTYFGLYVIYHLTASASGYPLG